MKLRRGNDFTLVCQSFCSQGGCLSSHPGSKLRGIGGCLGQYPGGVCLGGGSLPTPSPADAADGMHPTRMHSCFNCLSNRKFERLVGPLDEIVTICVAQIQRHNVISSCEVTSFDSRDTLPRRWLLYFNSLSHIGSMVTLTLLSSK